MVEYVPRFQARRELLQQLATWASEQGVFVEADLDRPDPDERNGRWRATSRRLGASLARDVFIDVRMTAVNLLDELPEAVSCVVPAEHPARTGERPAAPQEPTAVVADERETNQLPDRKKDAPVPLRRGGRLRQVEDMGVQGALL